MKTSTRHNDSELECLLSTDEALGSVSNTWTERHTDRLGKATGAQGNQDVRVLVSPKAMQIKNSAWMNSETQGWSRSPAVVPLSHTLRTTANPATVSQTCQLARLALTHFHGGGRRWDGPGPPLWAREGSGSRVATKISLFCPQRGNRRTDFRNKSTFVPAPVSFKCCRKDS